MTATPGRPDPSPSAVRISVGAFGVVAATVGVGELAGAVLGVASPVAAVAGQVIDAAPKPVKNFAISTFGTADKLALGIGIVVILAGIAAAVLRAATRRPLIRSLAVAGLAAIGWLAADTGHDGPTATLPTVIAAATAGLGLWLLREVQEVRAGDSGVPDPVGSEAAPSEAAEPQAVDPDVVVAEPTSMAATTRPRAEPMVTTRWRASVDRRQFMARAAALGAGGVTAGLVGRGVAGADATAARGKALLPAAPRSGPGAAPAVGPGARVGRGVEPFLTPNEDFYLIDTAFVPPRVDLDSWRLRIGGKVDRPLTLSFDDLAQRDVVERVITLCCVSNEVGGPYIGTARWLGVPLKDLLEEAGIRDGGDQVAMTSVDGWTCGFPTTIALDGRDAMVAIGMNGEPLPVRHGFPARVVVPGLYGYVSATKWVERIELTGWDDFDGYWIPRGWAKEGPIKTQSRIDVPRDGASLSSGLTPIAGVAWAQHRGIDRVEVQVDDGPWRPARLADEPTVDAWRQWVLEWEATAGRHRIRVRATDRDGETQTAELAPPDPDGATGWHTIEVDVG